MKARWKSTKARKVLTALQRLGYVPAKSRRGSHLKLKHPERGTYLWSFMGGDELGPPMLKRIARETGLTPDDL